MPQETKTRVGIPKLASIQKAIEIYYTTHYLSNRDINELFEKVSPSSILRLKKVVIEHSLDVCSACEFVKNTDNCKACKNPQRYTTRSGNDVCTAQAYEAWGFNIDDLEKRLAKLQKFQQKGQAL